VPLTIHSATGRHLFTVQVAATEEQQEHGLMFYRSLGADQGMSFPYDFGFLPKTIAPDGDPIDVLLLMDQPAYPGVAVPSRLLGVIEGEQVEGKQKNRNDRLVAVAEANHQYANVRKLSDLPEKWIVELQDFFVNYHKLEGKTYRLLGCKSAEVAFKLIEKARK